MLSHEDKKEIGEQLKTIKLCMHTNKKYNNPFYLKPEILRKYVKHATEKINEIFSKGA